MRKQDTEQAFLTYCWHFTICMGTDFVIGLVLMLKHNRITDELGLAIGFIESVAIESFTVKDDNIFQTDHFIIVKSFKFPLKIMLSPLPYYLIEIWVN